MKNKRLLVLSNSFLGLYSFRKEVIQALRNLEYEVWISCPVAEDQGKAAWFSEIGCHIIDTQFDRNGTNPFSDIRLMLYYWRIIRQVVPLAVLTYTIKPNLYGGMASAICRVPQIANITGLGVAVEYPGPLQRLTKILYKIGLSRTLVTFFQNEANYRFCKDHGMIKGRSILIPGSGVNVDYHVYQPYPDQEKPIRFVYCSRIRKEKGIEIYISVAKAMRKKYGSGVEFHVVGDCEGDYEVQLNRLTQEDFLVYHGCQADVRPFFAMSGCIIHPTYYPEGMSNVLLEGCATGRPIITTDRPGCREVVDEGINGFIVKPQDTEDCLDKVEKFINLSYELRKMMGEAARRKVEREFDRKVVVDLYLSEISMIN